MSRWTHVGTDACGDGRMWGRTHVGTDAFVRPASAASVGFPKHENIFATRATHSNVAPFATLECDFQSPKIADDQLQSPEGAPSISPARERWGKPTIMRGPPPSAVQLAPARPRCTAYQNVIVMGS